MFQVNNKSTRTTYGRRSGVFIVNFEHISHLFHFMIPKKIFIPSRSGLMSAELKLTVNHFLTYFCHVMNIQMSVASI